MNWVSRILNWLNPRKHKWRLAVLVALAPGGSLMLVEAFTQGISPDLKVVLLVSGIFFGIEAAGIVLGYFLFVEFLGLFRSSLN